MTPPKGIPYCAEHGKDCPHTHTLGPSPSDEEIDAFLGTLLGIEHTQYASAVVISRRQTVREFLRRVRDFGERPTPEPPVECICGPSALRVGTQSDCPYHHPPASTVT